MVGALLGVALASASAPWRQQVSVCRGLLRDVSKGERVFECVRKSTRRPLALVLFLPACVRVDLGVLKRWYTPDHSSENAFRLSKTSVLLLYEEEGVSSIGFSRFSERLSALSLPPQLHP